MVRHHDGMSQNDNDEEDTETKLALLSSVFSEASTQQLLDCLISAHGKNKSSN